MNGPTPSPYYRMSPVKRLAYYGAAATILGAIALVVWAGWSLFGPGNSFTSVRIQFVDATGVATSHPPTVTAGDTIAYQVSYCVDGDLPLPVTVRRSIQLKNHVVTYGMSELGYQITRPCETVVRMMEIPHLVRPGRYKILVYTDIQATPIRHEYAAWESPEFTITAADSTRTGPQGVQGEQGVQGVQGIQGETGLQGTSGEVRK